MRGLKTLLAILQGKAIVIIQKDKHKADVMVGKGVNKQFAINSMVGALKAMLL